LESADAALQESTGRGHFAVGPTRTAGLLEWVVRRPRVFIAQVVAPPIRIRSPSRCPSHRSQRLRGELAEKGSTNPSQAASQRRPSAT